MDSAKPTFEVGREQMELPRSRNSSGTRGSFGHSDNDMKVNYYNSLLQAPYEEKEKQTSMWQGATALMGSLLCKGSEVIRKGEEIVAKAGQKIDNTGIPEGFKSVVMSAVATTA